MSKRILKLENASKHFKEAPAFTDVSLAIHQGERVALVGPNGSGKTSLLRSIIGLLHFDNHDVQELFAKAGPPTLAERKRILYLPDDDTLLEQLTAREFFSFIATTYEAPVGGVERALELLRLLDFETLKVDSLIKTFSHGMRKKVQLASIAIAEFDLIIIDEPTNGLDPTATILLKSILNTSIPKSSTLLLSTHNLTFAEDVAQRFLLLRQQLLFDCSRAKLAKQTKSKSLEEAYASLVMAAKDTQK